MTDFTLLLFAILGLPAIAVSLSRIREFGWLDTMYVHLGAYTLVVFLCLFRKKLSYVVKAGLILVLLFLLGSASFPSLATAGSGVFFYLAIVVLATLYFGFRGGLTALAACMTGLLIATMATLSGRIAPVVDLNAYALSLSSWASKLASFTLLGGLCLGLMSMMQGWLLESIRDMAREIEEHRRTESNLQSSLAEKDVLLREIHHRVKSNLQVVMGLLDLHLSRAASESDIRAISDSKYRLKVMAQVHENLYSSGDLTRIDFSNFIKELASDMVQSYVPAAVEVELDLRLEPADLVMDTAIPCGIIVNELIANSLKYAFKDRNTGTIRIEFSRIDDDQFRLVIADNGIGITPDPDQVEEAHIGMSLVEAISRQLGAETTWTTEGGTEFAMIFREYREAGAQVY